MDKSNTYIKMCDCDEIQGAWKPEKKDFYRAWVRAHVGEEDTCEIDGIKGMGKRVVWLPRQDQLQQMLRKKMIYMLDTFCNWQCGLDRAYHSMEQLWLAFVMEQLYKKEWSGNEWKSI